MSQKRRESESRASLPRCAAFQGLSGLAIGTDDAHKKVKLAQELKRRTIPIHVARLRHPSRISCDAILERPPCHHRIYDHA